MVSQRELTGIEKGAEDGWERGNLTTEGALPYRRISNAAKRFSPIGGYVNFYAPVTRKGSTWPATPTPGPPSGYDRRRDTHGDILSITRPGILLPG